MILFYIDPGTGSMLFSIAIGLVTALYFVSKAILIKLKFIFTGGKHVVSKDHLSLVIYSEGTRYWNVFEHILDELEGRKYPTIFYTSSLDDPVCGKNYQHIQSEFIGEGNKAFTRLNFLEADVCLMTTPGLDVFQLKKSKGVRHYSHILHAVTDATTYRLFGLDYFDSILLTGEYQKDHLRQLERQRNIAEKELVVVGCPYLDALQKRLEQLPKDKEKGNFTVLVAPSWGKGSLLNKYGESLLNPLVNSEITIIIRPHPQSKQSEPEVLSSLEAKYTKHANVEWDYTPENLVSLSRADIMISDFSGVIFDYVFLFNRPFLYVIDDFDARAYDSYDLDEKPWMQRILPSIGVELKQESFALLPETLKETITDRTSHENRLKAKEIAWQYRGESGSQVANFLINTCASIAGGSTKITQ